MEILVKMACDAVLPTVPTSADLIAAGDVAPQSVSSPFQSCSHTDPGLRVVAGIASIAEHLGVGVPGCILAVVAGRRRLHLGIGHRNCSA
jgi:hypothetical protein